MGTRASTVGAVRRSRFLSLLAMSALAVPASLTTATVAMGSQSGDTADISLVHGIPDAVVDVYVNGVRVADDFVAGEVSDPLSVPAGSVTIAVTTGTALDDSEPLALAQTDVVPDASYATVAHLDERGQPTTTTFVNDTDEISVGSGKATIRHAAAGADGAQAVIAGSALGQLSNGDQIQAELANGVYAASLRDDSGTLAPTNVPVEPGENVILYAWGDAGVGPLNVTVQTLRLEGSTVAAPQLGLLGSNPSLPLWALVLGGVGAVGAAYLVPRLALSRVSGGGA